MLIGKAILRFRVKSFQSVFPAAARGIGPENPNPDHKQNAARDYKRFSQFLHNDFTRATSRWHSFSRGSRRTSICSPPPLPLFLTSQYPEAQELISYILLTHGGLYFPSSIVTDWRLREHTSWLFFSDLYALDLGIWGPFGVVGGFNPQ